MTTVADVFDLPERVHQGDFVLRLSEGVERAEQTLRDYVVTPQLARCFEDALSLIGGAVGEGTSKGAYLHGSFGSGKSHFMAVLALLLRGDAGARSTPELAGAVAKSNAWTTGRRFLVVPYHLIGATSMESAILGHYAEHVRAVHPAAPTPGFYRADRLFADARALRAHMGDAAFFRALNAAVRDGSGGGGQGGAPDGGGGGAGGNTGRHGGIGARRDGGVGAGQDDGGGGGSGGWGSLGSDWDPAAFDAALAAAPGDEDRVRLVGDLIDAFFGAMRSAGAADGGEHFVPLDEGLAVMSRHARELGYDALVLFLDELILWLASHAADPAFVNREGQKVAKLVEAMRADRPIPIVSFIARQRDLRELVGEHLPGAGQLGFADVLNWWEARFDQITLEDRNLPAIVQRRVLLPKDAAARAKLDAAFERTAKIREEVLSTLLTRDGDRAMFRQVYPFTPALVQTLIAVSSLLQRERTALKLMLQLLVDQGHRLELGDVIPVGDLFDVIAEGDEPFTQAMRMRFDDAKKLYRAKLLPLLEREHGVTAGEVREGRAADAQAAARFRNDDRLMKTLLLSAFAEGVEALRALTPARLAALNHGTVRSPIPGQESRIVLGKCRQWAAQVGEVKVSDDSANPTIALRIVGVDTEGVLENAQALDNYGYRVQKVRQLLYEGIGLADSPGDLLPQRYEMPWRGSRRICEILFRNVREMAPADFRNDKGTWRIVIDWPFDEPGHTPRDDLAQVRKFIGEGAPADTLVWLPAFFTEATRRDLGRLVLLDQVLAGNRLNEYGAHLSQTDRDQARGLLANQRDQMRARIRNCLLTAYGLSKADANAIDESHGLDEHFVSLNPRLALRPPVAAGFGEALRDVFAQALAASFPDHPEFGVEVRRPVLRRVWEVVERAAAEPEGRVEVERRIRDEVRHVVAPLDLGEMGETHFKLGRRWHDELDRKRAQHGGETLTVRDLRAWIESPERRGLDREVQNLVILTYALQKGLRFTLHGGPADAAIDRLDNGLELRDQALPDPGDWQRAVRLAGAVFGIAASPLMNARNAGELAEALRKAVAGHRADVDTLAASLRRRLQARGISAGDADRSRTADATLALLSALDRAEDDALVATLAAAEVPTSDVAMGESLKGARELADALAPDRWAIFEKLAGLPEPYRERARRIAAELDDALRFDEHVTPLADTLRRSQSEALDLLAEAATAAPPDTPRPPGPQPPDPSDPPDPPEPPESAPGSARGIRTGRRSVAATRVRDVFTEIEDAVRETGANRVDVDWKVYSDPKFRGS